jgi:CBS domain-containing protein
MSVVGEIMSDKKIVSLDVGSNPTVLDAVKLMLRNKTGSVIMVGRRGEPVGILTERDILRKISEAGQPLAETKAEEIMFSPVVTVKPYDSIETAAETMAGRKIKRLVVVEQDGSMVGVISLTDITKKLAKIMADEENRYGKLKALLDG